MPIDNALLHLGVGFVIYWILTKVLPTRGATLLTLGGTFLAALTNEIMDLLVKRWLDPIQQYSEGSDDLFWTLALPQLLCDWILKFRQHNCQDLPLPSGNPDWEDRGTPLLFLDL